MVLMHDCLCCPHECKGSHRCAAQERLPGDDATRCEPHEREAADAVQRMQHFAFDGKQLTDQGAQRRERQHAGSYEAHQRLCRLSVQLEVLVRHEGGSREQQ